MAGVAGSVAPVFRDEGYVATEIYDFYHAIIHNNKLYFCRQDGTIGHEPQEASDEYWFLSLDGNFGDAEMLGGETAEQWQAKVDNILNGTTPAGDSNALGGETAKEWQGKIDSKFDKIGGRIASESTHIPLEISGREDRGSSLVKFLSGDNVLGYIGFNSADELVFVPSSGSGAKDILHSGNVGSYALPITGGKVNGTIKLTMTGDTNHGFAQIYKNNSATVDNGTIIQDATPNEEKAWLAILAKTNEVQFRATDGNIYKLLHTGNKPTGTYTGNGDATARTINIGSFVGSAVMITGYGFTCIASIEGGGIYWSDTSTSVYKLTEAQLSLSAKGTLTIATTDGVNASGQTYKWWVL